MQRKKKKRRRRRRRRRRRTRGEKETAKIVDQVSSARPREKCP
jgi:hypothetical protein